jgi:hypothetical protein
MERIRSHRELDVYQLAFESAMRIFEVSKSFPNEEKYSLTDQIRRSSRSICANISEAFRKRKYPKSFVSKLSDAESEAGETQTPPLSFTPSPPLSLRERRSERVRNG